MQHFFVCFFFAVLGTELGASALSYLATFLFCILIQSLTNSENCHTGQEFDSAASVPQSAGIISVYHPARLGLFGFFA